MQNYYTSFNSSIWNLLVHADLYAYFYFSHIGSLEDNIENFQWAELAGGQRHNIDLKYNWEFRFPLLRNRMI